MSILYGQEICRDAYVLMIRVHDLLKKKGNSGFPAEPAKMPSSTADIIWCRDSVRFSGDSVTIQVQWVFILQDFGVLNRFNQTDAKNGRTGPPIFGIGLIEAIQDSEILKYEDPLDLDGDGISGKANRVAAPDYVGGGTGHLGRFGRKAGVAFLLQQVVNAYHQDIGITTDFLPIENGHPQSGGVVRDDAADPELPASVVQDVVFYVRTLAPPARGERTSSVLRGETVFNEVGCASCHVPSMRTGPNPVGALAGKNVVLYSDLLLHDMGPDLADNLNEGSATGTEWR